LIELAGVRVEVMVSGEVFIFRKSFIGKGLDGPGTRVIFIIVRKGRFVTVVVDCKRFLSAAAASKAWRASAIGQPSDFTTHNGMTPDISPL
jgi:hypothetical protein